MATFRHSKVSIRADCADKVSQIDPPRFSLVLEGNPSVVQVTGVATTPVESALMPGAAVMERLIATIGSAPGPTPTPL